MPTRTEPMPDEDQRLTAIEFQLWGRSGANGLVGDTKEIRASIARIERAMNEDRRGLTRGEKIALVATSASVIAAIVAVVALISSAPG